jgi:hypothetical protein
MLRLACDTAAVNDQIERLEAARQAMRALRPGVENREPWPLSRAYGVEPESDWGPKEVLAHVAEMIPFWLGQIEHVVTNGDEPVPFGRVTSDPVRIQRIGRDRTLPAAELFDRIDGAAELAAARLAKLSPPQSARRGLNPRLGEMTVDAIVGRFVVGHLDEHVAQLTEILARASEAPSDQTG